MDLSYKQEATVGGLVIVAIVLFVIGTTWLSGRSIGGRSTDYWQLQFPNVGGLKTSSAVRVSGVQVGKVERITLVAPGKVIVEVSLGKNIHPKKDASAQITAIGFVGDAVIDLNPGQAAEPLPKSQIIVGGIATGLTDRAGQLSYRADSVMMGLQTILNQRTADELHQTLVVLQGTLKTSQRMMALYADPNQGPVAELTKTMQSLQKLSARFDSTLANPAIARLLNGSDTLMRDLSAMSKHFAATSARLDTTLQAFNHGQGTLGKLATDTALYNNLRDVTKSFHELLDDLKKHPGKLSPSIKACIVPFAC